MRKNAEIRLKVSTLLKQEIENIAVEMLDLSLQTTVACLINLGLQVLYQKKKEGYAMHLINDYERAVKLISFQKGGKTNEKAIE